MVKRRAAAPEYRTDRSWAEEYIEERRFGLMRPVQVFHPMVDDRRQVGNIPYADPDLRRTWRGKVPTIGRPMDDKQIRGAYRLDDAEFIRISDARNKKNVPEGYIGTTSGIEPLEDLPLTVGAQQGFPTDNPVEINDFFNNDISSGEFFIAGPLTTENMRGERYPYYYNNPDAASKDTRIQWKITPEFDNPTEPEVRYPRRGAARIKNSLS